MFSIILIIFIVVIIVIIMIIVIIAHSARYWLNPLSSVDADACAWISYVRFLYYHHHHNHNYHHNHHNYHHHHYDNNHHGGTQGNPASSHMGWRTLPGPPQPWHVSSISITIQQEKERMSIRVYINRNILQPWHVSSISITIHHEKEGMDIKLCVDKNINKNPA